MRRTALLTATLLLGGCVTPSGIIDVTLPPQAEPIATQVELNCPDPDPTARCIGESLVLRQKPNPRRPGPPPVMRR